MRENGINLPGYKKKSFALPYRGGEIWFEHLDGIYDYEELVLEKLERDKQMLRRPSTSSYICFVLNETVVTEKIIYAILQSINGEKIFRKVAFVGLDKRSVKIIKKETKRIGIYSGFFDGLENAKEWLL